MSDMTSPEERRRMLYAAMLPHLRELASIQRMYPKRCIAAMYVGQAVEQLQRAMSWTMEGVTPRPSPPPQAEA